MISNISMFYDKVKFMNGYEAYINSIESISFVAYPLVIKGMGSMVSYFFIIF